MFDFLVGFLCIHLRNERKPVSRPHLLGHCTAMLGQDCESLDLAKGTVCCVGGERQALEVGAAQELFATSCLRRSAAWLRRRLNASATLEF